MFHLTLAVLLAPIPADNLGNPFASSVPCRGLLAAPDEPAAAILVSAPKTPGESQKAPSAASIAAEARAVRFNTGLTKTAKKGASSISLTPATFPETANTGDLARGMVVGEVQTTDVKGLPDGKSTIYVALVKDEHEAFFVHDGKIVGRGTVVVRKMDNKNDSASVRFAAEEGEVSPITICGRRWCITITIKKKQK